MNIFSLKEIKKHTLLFKMLSASCIIVCVLILSLSTILGTYYSKYIINLIHEMDTKLLSQISYSATYIDDLVKNISYSLLYNKNIEAFAFCKDPEDMYTISSSISKLQDICLYNPMIDSIYLYNKELDMMVSSKTGTIHTTEDFYDADAITLLKEFSTDTFLQPVHRRIDRSEFSSQVFTYFLAPNYDKSGQLGSVIILNLDSSYLSNLVSSLDTRYAEVKNNIWVLNNAGEVVCTTKPYTTPIDLSLLEDAHKTLSSDNSSGYYVNKVDKASYFISYIPAKSLNLNFISITPYNMLLNIIFKTSKFAIICCIFFLLIGIIFSILTSKKIYTPLDTLIKKLRSKVSSSPFDCSANDITILSESLLRSYAQIDELKLLKSSNLITLKDSLLKNYITQSASFSYTEVEKLTEIIKLNIAFTDTLNAYLIKLDNYHSLELHLAQKDISLFKYAISNMAAELTSTLCNNEVVNIGNDTLLVICSKPDNTENDFITALIPIVQALQAKTLDYFNISISVSIHNETFKINSLPSVYTILTTMMQEKIILGHQTILYPAILPTLSKETFTFPAEKEKLLLNALKVGNRDKCNELLIEIFDSLALLDTNYIYPSVIYISVSLYNNLNTIIESNTINLNDEFKEFFMSLLHLETLTDMKNEFYTFFDIIIERINTTQDNKSDILVGYITKLINDNYTDPNLCLNSIAHSLKMSPTYIGRLFKKSTSKSVAEYITCLRMEQVKYLLDTTDYSINKIVERVGLEKTNYFYTIFKKHFGVSLSSYKLELQSKEEN